MNKSEKKVFFANTLPTLKPVEIIEHEVTENRFIAIFTQVHGTSGEVAYEKEKFYFSKILLENPELAKCTPLSLFSVFLDIATKGLTLDNSSKALCYITFRNVRKKTDNGDVWEKRALLDISGYGELVLRERANQVKYADNPEVVYKDELNLVNQENTPEGVKIYHTIKHPRPTETGIAFIYVRIVRPDGSITFGTLDAEGIERLKNYSAENNGKWEKKDGRNVKVPGKPNALYNDIGFLKAKCLKHAFQSFPKLKLNNFSALVEGPEVAEELGINQDVIEHTTNQEPSFKDQSFNGDDLIKEDVKPVEQSKGITVETEDDIF